MNTPRTFTIKTGDRFVGLSGMVFTVDELSAPITGEEHELVPLVNENGVRTLKPHRNLLPKGADLSAGQLAREI